MSHDLFDPYTQDDIQDKYRECLELQWQADLDYFNRNRIIPPFAEDDGLIDNDEYKLLNHIGDNPPVYYGTITDSRALADTLGIKATGNLEAVVNKCITRGLITMAIDKLTDGSMKKRMEITFLGAEQRDRKDDEMEWGDGDE